MICEHSHMTCIGYGSTNEERSVILEQVVSYIEANKHLMTLREETDGEGEKHFPMK